MKERRGETRREDLSIFLVMEGRQETGRVCAGMGKGRGKGERGKTRVGVGEGKEGKIFIVRKGREWESLCGCEEKGETKVKKG